MMDVLAKIERNIPEGETWKEFAPTIQLDTDDFMYLFQKAKLGQAAEKCVDMCLFDGQYDEETASCTICIMKDFCILRANSGDGD